MKKKEKLRKLFKVYSSNLSFHFPDLENKFACPICKRIFSIEAIEAKQITLEDIIPKSIKKSFLTLTCQDCNNVVGGSHLDSHLRKRLEIEDIVAGEDTTPLRGKFVVGSESITADLNLQTSAKPNLEIIGIPKLNDPQKLQQVDKSFVTGIESFQITVDPGYKTLQSKISVLKIAYLMAFSYFGYGYIKYSFLDPIREQIMNPTEETGVLKGIFKIDSLPFGKSGVTILKKPDHLRCFLVTLDLSTKLNRYIGVVLPGFDEENTQIYLKWAEVDYTEKSRISPDIHEIIYDEKFLSNEKHKNYAIDKWISVQNQNKG